MTVNQDDQKLAIRSCMERVSDWRRWTFPAIHVDSRADLVKPLLIDFQVVVPHEVMAKGTGADAVYKREYRVSSDTSPERRLL